MTIIKKRILFPLLLGLLIVGEAFGQALPPLPPMPQGQLLDVWPFDGTNYLSLRRSAPLSLTNVALVPTWAGNGLQVDSTNAAWLTFPVVATNGMTNLNCSQGTIEMWFSPDWSSSDGLGAWGTILEAGNWNTNVSEATGAWGLYVSPDGSGIYFSAQTNGVITNYLNAPISWNAGDWHYIVLTYSATNSALYLEGQLVTNGPGVSTIPGQSVLTNGFSIGSDYATGLLQARAGFNYIATYNYELDTNTIASYYADDAPNVYPLPSSGFGSGLTTDADGSPPFPGGGSGTNSGGGGYTFNAPHYGSNDFWVEALSLGTNAFNSDPNSLTLIIHGTIADIDYEILSTTNLQSSNTVWTLEQDVIGSELTNFTAAAVPLGTNAQKFFKALALTFDSDGDGLPDWWEIRYSTAAFPLSATNADTGNTGIPDGLKQDSAGDGYNNLQKYEMGIPPGTWVTPQPPSGFTSILNSNGNSATLNWGLSPGKVQSYTILVDDNWTTNGFVVLTNVAGTSTSFVDANSPFSHGIQYEIQANYAGGSSTLSGQSDPTVNPAYNITVHFVRGSNGSVNMVISSVPGNIQAIRLYADFSLLGGVPYFSYWYEPGVDEGLGPIPSDYSMDIPLSSFTNGIYTLSDSQSPPYSGGWLYIQAIPTEGPPGPYSWDVNNFAPTHLPFLDGTQQVLQNLSFQLQEATSVDTFQVYNDANGGDIFVCSTNYATAGFYDPGYSTGGGSDWFDIFRPFEDNSYYRNFIYSPADLRPDGFLNTGLGFFNTLYGTGLGFTNAVQEYYFDITNFVANSYTNPPSPNLTGWQWSLPTRVFPSQIYGYYSDWSSLAEIGLAFTDTPSPGEFSFAGGQNLYGLDFQSVKAEFTNDTGSLEAAVIAAGSPVDNTTSNSTFNFYTSVAPPGYKLIDQYFGQPGGIWTFGGGGEAFANWDFMPGDAGFNVTNTTRPLLMSGMGNNVQYFAYAKEGLTNGSSNAFGYLQWYFDKAFLADADGNITTNQTGILSEYGDFFPTQPGKVYLTTKANALGQRGTNVVQIIGLCVDANHDGTMDTSFTGPDNTSSSQPFTFWVNSDCDYNGKNYSDPGKDIQGWYQDWQTFRINSQRDLEDYARLWITGVPSLLASNGYQVALSWNVISGNPAINLFASVETNGAMGYLTNDSIASSQTVVHVAPFPRGPGVALNVPFPISASHSYTFPPDYFATNSTKYLLFEGAGIGKGELVLTISQNGTNIASTSTFLDLHDVKDFYEVATIGDISDGGLLSAMTSKLTIQNALVPESNDDTNIIAFVHGINVGDWDAVNNGETVYKRLYWAGYRGKFTIIRWPCNYLTPPSPLVPEVFNLSEVQAYKASTSLTNYLGQLRNRLPGYRMNLLVHSQGNAMVSEAIREGATCDTYILTQSALPDSAYDVAAPTNATMASFESSSRTPEWQPMGYHGIYTNFTQRLVNFYNAQDGVLAIWVYDQEYLKPSGAYFYNGTNTYFGDDVLVTDSQESRGMVSRSRTLSIGQSGPEFAHGVIVNAIDLNAQYGFSDAISEHSAQWTRPIQTCFGYYRQVLDQIQPIQ